MNTLHEIFDENNEPKEADPFTNKRLLLILITGIFLAEVFAMLVVYLLKPEPYWLETLIDASIMIILIFPLVYFLHFQKLLKQINERNRTVELILKVLENLPLGVWVADEKGQMLYGNQASRKIWGGALYVGIAEYGKYKAWWADSGRTILPEEWAVVRAIKNGETCLGEEIEIENFDGVRKYILNSAMPIYQDGTIQGAIILNQDITKRKSTEQELEKSEALFKTAFQILPVGAWLADSSGKIIYGNPEGKRIWAGAPLVGIEQYGVYKGWWLNTGKPIEAEEWAVARAVKNGETSLNEEIEIECFDGTHKIILNSAIPVLDNQQRNFGVFVINQDITERKRFEQELIRSNELFERAFNSIDINFAYMDREFNFIRVNKDYADSAGHPAEFFIDKNHFVLYPDPENQAIFQQVVETGEPFSVFEKPFAYPEYPERGTTYWNWRLQPVWDANELVQGVVLSLVDVTERKRAEIQLELQNKELQALSLADQRHRQLAETLNAISLALSKTLDLRMVMNTLLEYVSRLIPSDHSFIVFAESETDLSLQSIREVIEGENLRYAVDMTFDRNEYPCLREVMDGQKSLLIRETRDYAGWNPFFTQEVIRSWLGIPIIASGKSIGVLSLAMTTPDSFADEHIRLANAIVVQAAVAIQNAWLYDQVRSGHERMQMLSRRLVEIQENERRYIARELHDEASQSLTALMFGLRLLEQDIDQPEAIQARVLELEKLTDEILDGLHRLATNLRPVGLDYVGLVPSLEQLVKGVDDRYPMKVRIKTIGLLQEVRLADEMETALYRIVQEALTNSVRHSNANNVDVILELREGKIIVMIEDDGIGFDMKNIQKSGHLGLLGIQERAEVLAGSLNIESNIGHGTTLVVEVPFDNQNLDRG